MNIHNIEVLRGTTARPPFGQKIVPIFLFFCLGRVILIMTKLKSRRQAPTKSGYFNYGPGKLKFSQGNIYLTMNIHNNKVLRGTTIHNNDVS
jgi:hypothetical protein